MAEGLAWLSTCKRLLQRLTQQSHHLLRHTAGSWPAVHRSSSSQSRLLAGHALCLRPGHQHMPVSLLPSQTALHLRLGSSLQTQYRRKAVLMYLLCHPLLQLLITSRQDLGLSTHPQTSLSKASRLQPPQAEQPHPQGRGRTLPLHPRGSHTAPILLCQAQMTTHLALLIPVRP